MGARYRSRGGAAPPECRTGAQDTRRRRGQRLDVRGTVRDTSTSVNARIKILASVPSASRTRPAWMVARNLARLFSSRRRFSEALVCWRLASWRAATEFRIPTWATITGHHHGRTGGFHLRRCGQPCLLVTRTHPRDAVRPAPKGSRSLEHLNRAGAGIVLILRGGHQTRRRNPQLGSGLHLSAPEVVVS